MKLALIETINKRPHDSDNNELKDRFSSFILQNKVTYEKVKCLKLDQLVTVTICMV